LEKIFELLSPIAHFFEKIMVFLYSNVVAQYGIVIILLTIIVRLLLVPLSITQTRSMVKMQKIQPELKELQKKYKDDKQRLQQETMEFYKKNNVNPLAGCLPLLLQMPVFFALYRALREPSEIVTSVLGEFTINGVVNPAYNFLWMDLNNKDPYYIMPILMAGTMFLSMKMTTTDPKQSKIMYIMPLVFGGISVTFPSGILVYWVTTNIWTMVQQWVVSRVITRRSVRAELMQKDKSTIEETELSDEEKKAIRRKIKKKRKKKR
jgi:YidC/Oxa1 family membrane protein insertase